MTEGSVNYSHSVGKIPAHLNKLFIFKEQWREIQKKETVGK